MLRKISWLLIVFPLYSSCTHQAAYVDATGSNFPPKIAAIFLSKCAISGCHNNLSYGAADSLNLSTWDDLFKGTGTGSVVIPFRSDFSSLCYFTNTDSSLGIVLQPAMPFERAPLSKEEYLTLRNWIESGAPDASGRVKFSDDTARSKFYITNRMCNVITVIDAGSLLQMRYIDAGDNNAAKYPYCIKVAPDRKSWYTSFFSQSSIVQKFSAGNDQWLFNINLGIGSWTSFDITADSRYGYFVDNSSPGKIAYVDLNTGAVLATYDFGGNFRYPTSAAINGHLKKMYVGTSSGNFIYSVDITNPLAPAIHEQPIDGSGAVSYQSSLNPTELLADTATGKCYIACAGSNEVRVVNMLNDSLLSVIPLNATPAYMAFARSTQKLFVSCPDDMAFAGNRGAVAIIDVRTESLIKKIKTGYQPYGLAVDEQRGVVAVVNANISSAGPASHHVSGCGRKNGNVTFIDLNTLDLVHGKLLEVAVFPFGAAAR